MTQQQLEALLGRSLTTREIANLSLYLEIAKEQLEQMLCMEIELQQGSTATPETRVFTGREGYSTTFTPIFTDVTSVKVDGEEITDFYTAFFDNRNAGFYNSVVFNHHIHNGHCEVEIKALWGFEDYPADLELLLARAFAGVSALYSTKDVKSKKTRAFTITYGDLSSDEIFLRTNSVTLSKYSMCRVGYVLHGGKC